MPTTYRRFLIVALSAMETLLQLVPRIWEGMNGLHAKMDEILTLARPQVTNVDPPYGQVVSQSFAGDTFVTRCRNILY